MTCLPQNRSTKKLGLVIDLDTCVGCHACAVACKQWNEGGQFGPLPDQDHSGKNPSGVWFNRIHTYEINLPNKTNSHAQSADCNTDKNSNFISTGFDHTGSMSLHFPRSCLHCETPDCVSVCPTGASFKRAEDGIVLVDPDLCIGCKLCSWACPYGAREYSPARGVMQKCTLCVDRIYNTQLPEQDREPACVQACPTRARHFGDLGDPQSAVSQMVVERLGFDLMPEFGNQPTNKYLPPRAKRNISDDSAHNAFPSDTPLDTKALPSVLKWLDRVLSR